MVLLGGGHLELKKMHKGDFWGLFGIRLGRCPGIIPEKSLLFGNLFQLPVFFSLMLLHYQPGMQVSRLLGFGKLSCIFLNKCETCYTLQEGISFFGIL